ncbi:MAG: hypothetical protein LBQ02_02175 [Candidatus Nomurabacteria bacterium]|jgi:hypothetical protein|nr:hypothetical protein [Candidatus Nomurabacteria bacterium]
MINDVRKRARQLRKMEQKNIRRARNQQYRRWGKEKIFSRSSLLLGVAGACLMPLGFTFQVIGLGLAVIGLIFGVTSFKWGVTPRFFSGLGGLVSFGVVTYFALALLVFGWIRNPFTIEEWNMRRETAVNGVVQQIQNYQTNNKGQIPDEGNLERFRVDYLEKITDFFDPGKQMPYLITINSETPVDHTGWINIHAGENCNYHKGAAMFCVEIMREDGSIYRLGNGRTNAGYGQ